MADMSLSMRIGAVIDGSLNRVLGGVNRDLDRLGSTTTQLGARQERLNRIIERGMRSGNRDLTRFRREQERVTRAIEETRQAQERLNRSTERERRIGEAQSKAGGNLATSTAQLAAFALPVGASVKAAIEFESAMAEVGKTVEFTAGNSLPKLGEELKQLSLQIPLSANELAAIAASGGQLGVADKDLIGFTTTVAKMGVAFDMSADQAGDAMAKLSNVMQIPIKEIDRIGDMINTISNNSPAKAREIVAALSQVGSSVKSAGYSEQFSVGLTGALIAQGREASVTANAIESMITSFSTLDMATKRQIVGFNKLGINHNDFAKRFKEDGQAATLEFFDLVNQLPTEERTGVVSSIIGLNYGGDILSLANNTALLGNNLDLLGTNADGTAKYLGSMNAEFDSISATKANEIQLLKNNLNVLAITLGDALLPALGDAITAITPVIQSFAAWAKANPELIASTVKIVGGLLLANAAFWGVSFAVLSVIRPIASLVTTFNRLRAGITDLRNMAILGQLSPMVMRLVGAIRLVGGVIPMVGLLASAALLIYTYWEPIKAFFTGLFTGIIDGLAPVKGLLNDVMAPMRDALAPLKPIIDPLIGTLSMLGTKVQFSADSMMKVKAAGSAVGYAIGTVLKYLIVAVPAFVSAIVIGFKVVGTAIGTMVGAVVVKGGQLIRFFGSMWNRLKAFANSGIKNILTTIASFTPLGLFIRAFSAVDGYFGGLAARFRQFGVNIIQGLISGVQAKFGALKATITNMGDSVSGWFKSKLGINSPSKVFTKLGGGIPEGAALGITQQTPLALKASEQMAKRLAQTQYSNSVLGSQSLGGGMSAGSISFSPTINVQVSAGSGDISGQVQQGLAASYAEFERMLEQVENNRQRRAFA